MRWIFDSFQFKNEFPEFIPSLALVSVVSAAIKSIFTECREKPTTNRFVDNMAIRNVLPGQKRHLFPLTRYKTALKLSSARMLLAISLADSANIAAYDCCYLEYQY